MTAAAEIRSLCHQVTNEMQIVLGASELGDTESSLRAVGRATAVIFRLQSELIRRVVKPQRKVVWPIPTEGD